MYTFLTKLIVQLSISITLSTESFNDVGEKKKKGKKKKKRKRKKKKKKTTTTTTTTKHNSNTLLVNAKLRCEEQQPISTGSSWELDGN